MAHTPYDELDSLHLDTFIDWFEDDPAVEREALLAALRRDLDDLPTEPGEREDAIVERLLQHAKNSIADDWLLEEPRLGEGSRSAVLRGDARTEAYVQYRGRDALKVLFHPEKDSNPRGYLQATANRIHRKLVGRDRPSHVEDDQGVHGVGKAWSGGPSSSDEAHDDRAWQCILKDPEGMRRKNPALVEELVFGARWGAFLQLPLDEAARVHAHGRLLHRLAESVTAKLISQAWAALPRVCKSKDPDVRRRHRRVLAEWLRSGFTVSAAEQAKRHGYAAHHTVSRLRTAVWDEAFGRQNRRRRIGVMAAELTLRIYRTSAQVPLQLDQDLVEARFEVAP